MLFLSSFPGIAFLLKFVNNVFLHLSNTVDTNNHAELQHTVLMSQENMVMQEPELIVDIAGNHATEPIIEYLPRPTRNESC